MIKIPEQQVVPLFYVPVKYLCYSRHIECYLFFIAPFAILYEKIINTFYYLINKSIIDDSEFEKHIINIIESSGFINKETHKLELDLFELEMVQNRIKKLLSGRRK